MLPLFTLWWSGCTPSDRSHLRQPLLLNLHFNGVDLFLVRSLDIEVWFVLKFERPWCGIAVLWASGCIVRTEELWVGSHEWGRIFVSPALGAGKKKKKATVYYWAWINRVKGEAWALSVLLGQQKARRRNFYIGWMDGLTFFLSRHWRRVGLSQCGQSVTAGFCKFEDCSLFREWFVKVGPTYIPWKVTNQSKEWRQELWIHLHIVPSVCVFGMYCFSLSCTRKRGMFLVEKKIMREPILFLKMKQNTDKFKST